MNSEFARVVLRISVFVILATSNGYAGTLGDKKALYTSLLTDYNRDILPVKQQSDFVSVNIALSVVSLNEIDEVLEKFALSGFFTISWYDQSMVWNTSDYGLMNNLLVSYDHVWVPEILLINPSEKLKSLGEDWNQIRYHFDGRAEWYPGDLIKATCTIDVYYFPYDIQECELLMQVWGLGINEVKLHANRDYVDLSNMAPHGSWKIIETKAYVTEFEGSSQAKFKFCFERRPQYVIVNVILPIMFLCFLNVMAFLLPVDSGERISYAITVLLAIAVYMTIVSDNLPKTSEPLPLISYLLIICLIVSVLVTVVIVLNLRLFHKDSDEPVPKWLSRIYQTWTCKTCVKRNGDNNAEKDQYSTTVTEIGLLPSNKVGLSPQEGNGEAQIEDNSISWKDISTLVDYSALIVSTLTLIISFTVFLLLAKTSTN